LERPNSLEFLHKTAHLVYGYYEHKSPHDDYPAQKRIHFDDKVAIQDHETLTNPSLPHLFLGPACGTKALTETAAELGKENAIEKGPNAPIVKKCASRRMAVKLSVHTQCPKSKIMLI
jgi:hypothetical protein